MIMIMIINWFGIIIRNRPADEMNWERRNKNHMSEPASRRKREKKAKDDETTTRGAQ